MNFCASCLDPKISSTKPSADGREVTNLVSEDDGTRRRGFMGEYFIRPPVDVCLTFPVLVDISHIVIKTKLEHMNTTGFFIFTRPEYRRQTGIKQTSEDKQNFLKTEDDDDTPKASTSSDSTLLSDFYSCAPPSLLESRSAPAAAFSTSMYADNAPKASIKSTTRPISNTKSPDETFDDVYFCVGKFFTQNETKVVLKNPFYQHWLNLPLTKPDENQSELHFKGSLRHGNREVLKRVRSLIVRIMRTEVLGPPVIHSLEVWGQPGISTNKKQRKCLLDKWKKRKQEDMSVPNIPRLYNSELEAVYSPATESSISTDTSIPKDLLDIPEDFLDPLTCEVMTVPLLLPSGQSIDAHTLEKFVAHEALWGRPASDPFTGVPFKERRHPTPNVPLKARIDRFLLLHTDHPELQTVGRTVGSSGVFGGHPGGGTNVTSGNNQMKRTYDAVFKSKEKAESLSSQISNEHKPTKPTTSTSNCKDLNRRQNKKGVSKPSTSQLDVVCQNKTDPKPSRSHTKETEIPGVKILNTGPTLPKKVSSYTTPETAKSTGRHSLVRMIGGAVSVNQRSAVQRKVKVHKPFEKPPNITCGDTKHKEYEVLPLTLEKCSCGEKDSLYRLPCKHLFCRACLLHLQIPAGESKCSNCSKEFKKSDVIKHHSKSVFS